MNRGQIGFEIMVATAIVIFLLSVVATVVRGKEREIRDTKSHLERLGACRLVSSAIVSTFSGGNGTDLIIRNPDYTVHLIGEPRVVSVGSTGGVETTCVNRTIGETTWEDCTTVERPSDLVTCTYIPVLVSMPPGGTLTLEPGDIRFHRTGEEVVITNMNYSQPEA